MHLRPGLWACNIVLSQETNLGVPGVTKVSLGLTKVLPGFNMFSKVLTGFPIVTC